jgi:hypothetical protein
MFTNINYNYERSTSVIHIVFYTKILSELFINYNDLSLFLIVYTYN